MLNYLRSEWYRILHGREIYLFTGVLCAIVLAANVILWAMAHTPAAAPMQSMSGYLWPMTNTREASAISSPRALAMTRLLTLVRF